MQVYSSSAVLSSAELVTSNEVLPSERAMSMHCIDSKDHASSC